MKNAYAVALTLDIAKSFAESALGGKTKRDLIKRGTWFDRQVATNTMSDMY